jgi:phospholipid transport system substrate-binding protein
MRISRVVVLLVSLTFFLPAGSFAATGDVTKELKATVDNVLEVLKDKELKKPENSQKRREKIRQEIQKQFNFEEMSKRSLAQHWAQRSPKEKEEFISLFKDLLERSYIKKIEAYTDEKIVYSNEMPDGEYSVVKTKIITAKNIEIPIDYRLLKGAAQWSVYDVVIEGVSLINNYRTQFNKIIRSQSFEALLKRMKNKQEEETSLE